MKTRSFALVLVVLAAALAVGCGSSTAPSTVSSVTVAGAVPAVGSSAQFTATANYLSSTPQDVTSISTWSSSNTAIATVSSTGVVTAVASGAVTISATFSNVMGSDAVTVP
jgi:uncharacterized protein YjdB